MSAVEIRFTALPAHVRTARLIATAVARRAGVEGGLLDEIRLGVGEACARAVSVQQRVAPRTPVTMTVADETDRLVVTVADAGTEPDDPQPEGDPFGLGSGETEEGLASGFGLAVVAGLADDLDVLRAPSGTVVRMTWKLAGAVAGVGAQPG